MALDKIKNILDEKRQEKKLFSKIKKKDQDAFIKAYDLYIDQIYRFVYFKISNAEEANDLTSAIFLKTWNYIQNNSVTDFKTLRALIYKIARTSIIDYYRKNSKMTTVAFEKDGEFGQKEFADEKQDVLKKIEIASDFAAVTEKLPELKDEYREVIILRFINELSINEIAQIINKSKGSVRVLIYRALKALREICE